jgi:hypothetical protein
MWSGDDEVLTISVLDDAGVAVTLDGVTELLFVVKESQSSASESIRKTLGHGVVITDSDNGEYEVTISTPDTESLNGAYFWNAVVTDDVNGDYTGGFGYLIIKGKAASRGSYCELEEAMALIADVQITVNTTPSLAVAKIIVETIARDIDGVLMGRGYEFPITSTKALNFLKTTNQYGACAAIIKSKKPIDTGMGSDRGAFGYYDAVYRRNLVMLASPEFNLTSDSSATEDTGFSAGWSSLDETNVPFWTRGTEY